MTARSPGSALKATPNDRIGPVDARGTQTAVCYGESALIRLSAAVILEMLVTAITVSQFRGAVQHRHRIFNFVRNVGCQSAFWSHFSGSTLAVQQRHQLVTVHARIGPQFAPFEFPQLCSDPWSCHHVLHQ